MMLNPAAVPQGNAFSVFQAGLFFDNNILGIRQAGALDLIPPKNGRSVVFPRGTLTYPSLAAGTVPSVLNGFFEDTLSSQYLQGHFVVDGPAAVIALGEYLSVGVGLRVRGSATAKQIPQGLIPITHANQPPFVPYPVSPFRGSGVIYMEIPLNLAFSKVTGLQILSLGLALKPLFPMVAGFVDSRDTLKISQRLSNSFTLDDVDGEMGFSVWSRNAATGRISRSLNGFGIGIDLGVRLTEGEGRWYVGASITDIGYLAFRQNSATYGITSVGVSNHSGSTLVKNLARGNVILAANELSTAVLGSPSAGFTGNRFGLILPTTFRFQGGIGLGNTLFLSAMANVPLLKGPRNLQSISAFGLAPSWEKGAWCLRVPLTLVNQQRLLTGIALRAGPLTLGTDHLQSWLGSKKLKGTDIYFALQLPFIYGTDGRSSGKGGRRDSSLFRCFTF